MSLSDYLKKVQSGNFIFPDFSDECPLCGGRHCAVRIGYYYRWTIDFDLKNNTIVFFHIPIARYLCRRVHKPRYKHKTFSLLPTPLVPYNRISITLMMYILQLFFTQESMPHALEKMDLLTPGDIFFSEKMIHHLLEILEQSRIKLVLFFRQYPDNRAPPGFQALSLQEIVTYLCNDPVSCHEHPVMGAYYLSVLYYKIQGEYQKNARCLFGTASQFRG
jgi:hypothetical protein